MSSCTPEDNYSEEEGWKGPKPLFLAGLYSTWTNPEGKTVHSYTVITRYS